MANQWSVSSGGVCITADTQSEAFSALSDYVDTVLSEQGGGVVAVTIGLVEDQWELVAFVS